MACSNVHGSGGAAECQDDGRSDSTTASDTGASHHTMAPPNGKARGTFKPPRKVTKPDEWGLFLNYIETRENFQLLFNSGNQTLVGGQYIKKTAAWDIAAAYLKGVGFKETTGKNLEKKWQRYISKFKTARKKSLDTGFGLDEEDQATGMTIAEKLEGLCPHYHRLDALFGSRANIQPPAVSQRIGFQHMAPAPECVLSTETPGESTETPLDTEHVHPLGHTLDEYDKEPLTPRWVQEQSDAIAEDQSQQPEDMDVNEGWDDVMEDEFSPERPLPTDVGVGTEENVNQSSPTPQAPQQATPLPTRQTSTDRPSSGTTPRNGNSNPTRTNSNGGSNQAPGNKAPTPGASSKGRGADHDKAKSAATSKPSLATVFQESKAQEAEFKLKYIEKKGDWKMKELEDKREARHDDYLKRKYELEFGANEKKEERALQFQEARKQRIHEAKVAKSKHKLELIVAGWAAAKPQDEINSFLVQL